MVRGNDCAQTGPCGIAIGCKRGGGRSNINTSHSSGDELQEQEGVSTIMRRKRDFWGAASHCAEYNEKIVLIPNMMRELE